MKAFGLVVRSGLSGNNVCVDVNATRGQLPGQTLIHLAGWGDTIGYSLNVGGRRYLPVAYEQTAEGVKEVQLELTISRLDAMRDVAQYLADLADGRLDLEWLELGRKC